MLLPIVCIVKNTDGGENMQSSSWDEQKDSWRCIGVPNPSDHRSYLGSWKTCSRASPPVDGESVDLNRTSESVFFIIIHGDSYAPRPRLGKHHHRMSQGTLRGQEVRRGAGSPLGWKL